jgi:hypothetical protein
MLWIRGIDVLPVLVSKQEVEGKMVRYQDMLDGLK